VDEVAIERQQAAGRERVAAIQQRLRRQNLVERIVTQRIKEECVDSVATPICGLAGVRCDTFVRNFSVTQSEAEKRCLRQVSFLRRVELEECSTTGRTSREADLTSVPEAEGDAARDAEPPAPAQATSTSEGIRQCVVKGSGVRGWGFAVGGCGEGSEGLVGVEGLRLNTEG